MLWVWQSLKTMSAVSIGVDSAGALVCLLSEVIRLVITFNGYMRRDVHPVNGAPRPV